jgi:hypothetical protein
MKYLMLVCVDENVELTPEQQQSVDSAAEAWVAEMQARGIRVDGNRLRPVSDATVVRSGDGQLLVTDGPFAETKEQIGGFDVLDCADLDEAIEVASKHPVAAIGALEIRPFWQE